MHRGDARPDEQNSRPGRAALAHLEPTRRFFGNAVGEGRGHVIERGHHRLVGVIALRRQFRALGRDGCDDDRLVVRKRKSLHDLDVVEIVPVLVIPRGVRGTASGGGRVKLGQPEGQEKREGAVFFYAPGR